MDSITQKPLITTIIPTYRRPKLLQRAIRSVLNQIYPHFQVCVYDNASDDETAAVVTEIANEDPRVKYYCHPQNIGGIQNFNYGMKCVTTPYFCLLGDDNALLPNFLEVAIESLERYPEAIFFAGRTIMVNEKGKKVGASLNDWQSGLISPPHGLLNIWEKGLTWESVLFKSEVIKAVGLLDPSLGGSADEDFLMRLARRYVFYVLKEPCALFLCHDNSWTVNRDLSEYLSSSRRIMEQWLSDGDLSDTVKKQIVKRWKVFVKEKISGYVYIRTILGNDLKTLATASKFMKKEVGLSYKPLRAILIARLVNCNRFSKILLSSFIHLYIELKRKLIILKNRKEYDSMITKMS